MRKDTSNVIKDFLCENRSEHHTTEIKYLRFYYYHCNIITADGGYIPPCIITAHGGYIPPVL